MDRQRLAEALAYEQQRRSRLANVIPTAQPGDPEVIPEQGVRSRLENLSSGLGQGGVNTLEGLRQLVTSPIKTGRAMVEGGVEMIRDPALIAEALRETGRRAASGPLGLGEVIGESLNPMRVRSRPVMQEIDVYHGSPHRFEEFDASKIGTGEGAQAYGHGIYFAENPDVARTYRQIPEFDDSGLGGYVMPRAASDEILALYNDAQKLNDANWESGLGEASIKVYNEILHGEYGPQQLKKKVEQWYWDDPTKLAEAQGAVRKAAEVESRYKGNLYKADLPDEMVDRMLDWDKPLSEQPKVLRALLNSDDEWKAYTAQLSPKSRKLAEDMAVGAKPNTGDEGFKLFKQLDADNPNADHNAIYDVIRKYNPRTTDQDWIMSMMSGSAAPGAGIRGGGGADLYNTLGGGEQAAQRLRAAGIPGMQYLDAGSRGQGGSGTRNFVVFPGEEKKVTILSRD